MISSPEVSDFFRRLKLNQKWLNGFKSNLQSLGWILGDAESKAYVNKEVKVWLADLNEVSYDLEDLLEEIVTQESSHQDKPRNIKIRIQGIFSAKLSSLEKVLKQRLEEVTVKIENLQRQSDTLGLRKASQIKRELVVGRYCIEDEPQAIGRDEDKEAMLKLLLSDGVSADHDHPTVVGGRGVGKTTLAQLVYNDERVKKQFEFKAWIHVSEDFDDMSLTKAIFLAFTDRPSYIEDLDILQTSLKKHLYQKKFLLVLDNLTMRFDWTNLQKVLTAGSSGSRIIVTCNHPKLKGTMADKPFPSHPSSDESFPSHTSSDKPFPSLEILVFQEMMEWEEWISPEVEGENFPSLKRIGISGCPKLAKCSPLHLPPSAEVEISGCPLLRVPVTDGNKMQFRSDDKLARRPLMPPVWTKFQLPESYRVLLKNDDEIATQYLEHRINNISSPSHSSPPESPMLLTEFEFEKQLHESHSRKENLLDIASASTPQKIEELQLRDSIAVHSTDDSIKSNRPPPESYKHLTEDSSAKHEGALDTSSAAAEISDPDTDDPINDGGDKTQFRRNKKLLDRPSSSRLQEIEELHLLSHENMFEAQKNMSEINTFESSVRESFSSVFFKPLEHMISSPEVSDFFLRLELNEKWLNNLLSLDKLLGDAESKAYVNKEVEVWLDDLNEVSYDLEDLLEEIVTEELSHQDKPRNIKIGIQGIFSAKLSSLEKVIKQRLEEITVKLENLQRNSDTLGLRKASRIKREPCQQSLVVGRYKDKEAIIKLLLSDKSGFICDIMGNDGYFKVSRNTRHLLISGDKNLAEKCKAIGAAKFLRTLILYKPYWENESSQLSVELLNDLFEALQRLRICISGCPKLAKCSPLRLPPSAEIELSECSLLRVPVTDGNTMKFVSDNKPAPRPPMLSNELALPEPSVTAEKHLHESNSRKKMLLGRPSTLRLSEVEELQLPDINVAHSTDVSITSSRPPPESPMPLTEDSSAKHGGALDTFSAATEISYEGNKARFRGNKKLLDRHSTSRFQEIEELQLPVSNVVRRTDVSATSNSPPPESSKRLTEDSSSKHVGASDNSSDTTEISSDTNTDDPINVWYDEESLEDISSSEQESLNVSEISQLKRLPKLYSLKIESCKALKSLTEELMHSNLRHLYIIDCPFLKSIQASQLPMALETLYIRQCKKLEFLSVEETMGKHTSVEHLSIERSCDPLNTFPLSLFPKLKNVSIRDCAKFNSISITEDHMSLNSMEIRDCANLESLLKSGLRTPNLTSILLSNCKNLRQLPGQLHELTSLQSLIINECPELDSIPEGGLPSSLNLLRISSCHKLTPCLEWGLHKLNNFSRIEFEGGCRDLESFPEQNLLPRNLISLQIGRFPNLKILNYKGLQHLKSLETLKINSCDKLQSLPEEGLPSSLSYLYISDCLLLKSKLQNRRGKEWWMQTSPIDGTKDRCTSNFFAFHARDVLLDTCFAVMFLSPFVLLMEA
ncbi:hypothetical protein EZV62_017248 [Acer yangbiense]|uniref:NB-ARC domain-containing protein n=1 Tax=Acer yangbiense TaxID=1000413 RepID=A0A5C7HGW5_9ROSI|nr:hypothetical protein EZV62_017248 [Acer yangbiense]